MRIDRLAPLAALPLILLSSPALAQDLDAPPEPGTVESLGVYRAAPPDEIDLTQDDRTELPADAATPAQQEECRRQQEAAIVREEIVVCGEVADQSQYRTMSRKDAQARYARETNTQGAFGAPDHAPDIAGPGIFRGKPTISGVCLPLSCPKALPRFIDVTALPEAPAGSDADRIARGLPPLGNDTGTPQQLDEEAPAEPEDEDGSIGE